jgi:hypothetical protein
VPAERQEHPVVALEEQLEGVFVAFAGTRGEAIVRQVE